MSENQDTEELKAMLAELKTLADSGDAEAQAVLAECYFKGWGFEKNIAAGTEYFEKAEAQNFDFDETVYTFVAQNYCALKRYEPAARLFEKSIELGDADAYFGLGKLYLLGLGVGQNPAKAFDCFKNAYDFGFKTPELLCLLGEAYLDGTGTPKNPRLAIQFFERASSDSYLEADYQLAYIYYNGILGETDYARATRYFEKIQHIACDKDEKISAALNECRQKTLSKKSKQKQHPPAKNENPVPAEAVPASEEVSVPAEAVP
ncbi:MAG: sel1 repeat family protein, partial [Opitutales bacterium]|nr:sel1 repeat family protein [Opitutales bacterium]